MALPMRPTEWHQRARRAELVGMAAGAVGGILLATVPIPWAFAGAFAGTSAVGFTAAALCRWRGRRLREHELDERPQPGRERGPWR